MITLNVGDLVQYTIDEDYWNGKVGVVWQTRNKVGLAFICWADKLANSTWVRYEDLMILNRRK
jgi:hypothetical protein